MGARAPRPLWRAFSPKARGAIVALSLWGPGQGALAQTITAAAYAEPTDRYDHAVLGDALEWGALRLTLSDGSERLYRLPEALVFEDIAPRLADVDGDGAPEVIVVETALATGARLAVWGAEGRRAATPHIGQTHRWLAPVGAADFDGDGKIEIAVVDRPHLARILTLWRYEAGSLRLAATASGFTNHRIGWDYIAGGVRQCAGASEMIVADPDWRRILAVRFDGAQVTAKDLGRYSAEAMRAATLCRG